MASSPFYFKQFTIEQDRSAMKVGTDGVLLGAWVQIDDAVDSILDIGTGTGLIGLQLAQRSQAQVIDALEIEESAFEQAVQNFENSIWADRLFCYHASLQEFAEEIDDTYDLIVSNPPFYTNGFKELQPERAIARHDLSLNHKELLDCTFKLLSQNGSAAFIIPFSEEDKFVELAKNSGLYLHRCTRVRGNETSPLKRALMQLKKTPAETEYSELVIEIERHLYTEDYLELVKDFYLKL